MLCVCVSHLKFRFQPVQMYFGIIDQFQYHEKIRNVKLICLKMLVVAVWILSGCMQNDRAVSGIFLY